MSPSAISARCLTKKYSKEAFALKDVSFDLEGDRIIGLLGANGAGKTTLINTLMGFIFPTGGEIRVFGKRPHHAYSRIGYTGERPDYHKNFSANNLLNYLAAIRGIEKSLRRQRRDEALATVGLEQCGDKPLWKMSKGMLQRFSIAQSLLHDPDLLVMDEPMSGLDPLAQKEFREIISRLKRPGRTIVFSSHLLFHLEKLCDSILVLDRGMLMYDGAIEADSAGAETIIKVAMPLNADRIQWLAEAGVKANSNVISIGSEPELVKHVIRFLLDQDIEIEKLEKEKSSLEELFLEKIKA